MEINIQQPTPAPVPKCKIRATPIESGDGRRRTFVLDGRAIEAGEIVSISVYDAAALVALHKAEYA